MKNDGLPLRYVFDLIQARDNHIQNSAINCITIIYKMEAFSLLKL